MKLLKIQDAEGQLTLSLDELITLSNAINELCYGMGVSDTDLQTRIGAPPSELYELLRQLQTTIDSMESREKTNQRQAIRVSCGHREKCATIPTSS